MPATTDLIVLCGGRGSRLGSLTTATPKPLLPVGEQPFLLRLLLHMKQQGFTRYVLAAHYLADCFRTFLSVYGHLLPDVQLIVEPMPLGTGGALRHAVDSVRSSTFVALNGDSWVSQPLAPVLAQHRQTGCVFTAVGVPAAHVQGEALNKGVWRVSPHGTLLGFTTQESVSEGWVNAGIYVMERERVRLWPQGGYDLEANLETLLRGSKAEVFCSDGELIDIGTPACYQHTVQRFGPANELSGRVITA